MPRTRVPRVIPQYKVCARKTCVHNGKPILVATGFNRNKQNADGCHSYCNDCRREIRRESKLRKIERQREVL